MTEAQEAPPTGDSGEVTDEDLQAAQTEVEELRLAVAMAQSDLAGRQAAVQRQIDMNQLLAERARLQVQLAQAQAAAQPEVVQAAAAGPLAQAKAQLKAAQEQSTQVGPVDTNAEVSEEQTAENELPTAESIAARNADTEEKMKSEAENLVSSPAVTAPPPVGTHRLDTSASDTSSNGE